MTRAYCCLFAHSNNTPVCTHTPLVCVYIRVCIYIYMYIYTHTHCCVFAHSSNTPFCTYTSRVCVCVCVFSFGAVPCCKKNWWQLASRCCWNRARPWHASEVVSFLVGLRTYQHPGVCVCIYISCYRLEESQLGTKYWFISHLQQFHVCTFPPISFMSVPSLRSVI